MSLDNTTIEIRGLPIKNFIIMGVIAGSKEYIRKEFPATIDNLISVLIINLQKGSVWGIVNTSNPNISRKILLKRVIN